VLLLDSAFWRPFCCWAWLPRSESVPAFFTVGPDSESTVTGRGVCGYGGERELWLTSLCKFARGSLRLWHYLVKAIRGNEVCD
jgi:hypothetical protein